MRPFLLFLLALFVTSAEAAAPQPPTDALNAGFNILTYGPNVTLSGTNQNWFCSPSNLGVQNSDGSMKVVGEPNSNNASCFAGKGTAYLGIGGGGYIEGTLFWTGSFPPPSGWPSWWFGNYEYTLNGPSGTSAWPGQPSGYGHWIEPDIMEYGSNTQFGSAYHDWYGTQPNPPHIDSNIPRVNVASAATPHRYGLLWVPATNTTPGHAAYYLDGVKEPGSDIYWNKFNSNLGPPPPGFCTSLPIPAPPACSAGSEWDLQHIIPIVGTPASLPMTLTNVSVWQASGASDIPAITTTPIAINAPTSVSVNFGVQKAVTGVSVNDVSFPNDLINVTVTLTSPGTLSASGASGNGTSTITLATSQASVNTSLASLAVTVPSTFSGGGNGTITYTVADQHFINPVTKTTTVQVVSTPVTVPVPAPLTGTITLNAWQSFDQSFGGITLACGKPFHFNLVQPPQYNPSAYKYPLYIWLHPDYQGDPWYTGGNTDPLFLTNDEGGSYNTVAWQTQFPAFYMLPYADQTNGNGTSGSCSSDGNDAVQNWGGWFNNGTTGSGTNYSGDTGPNVFALIDAINLIKSQYSIDSSRIYVNGFSLGAIGSGYLCQHYNLVNGSTPIFAACLESGGGVDQADTPVTSTTASIMNQVPTWYFSGANDTLSPPSSYNTPLCSALGGNPGSLTGITSAPANRCGTSQMRYTLCPTCGHQDTDASGNPVWTNLAMNSFAFAQGGGGGTTTATAQRAADFLNMISVQGGISGGGTPYLNAAQQVADLQYLGITHYRDTLAITMSGFSLTALQALISGGISMVAEVPYGTVSPSTQIAQLQAWQALAGGGGTSNPNSFSADFSADFGGGAAGTPVQTTAVYGIEGVNDPTQGCITYNSSSGGTGSPCTGTTWLPVAQYMADYITAIKTTPSLQNLPLYGVSRAGGEPNNVGLQYVTVPTPLPSGVLMPAGSTVAGALTDHVYPMDQSTYSGVSKACQPNDPTAGNAFNIETHASHVTTYARSFAGYASDAVADVLPRAVTEFGYPTTGPGPSANGDRVNEDKKGRCILNGLMTAWQTGVQLISIYDLYDLSGSGYGLMAGSGSPNLSGTYLHNFTTALADIGSGARSFVPTTLTYAVSGLPSTASQQLLETSAGHFKLVLWNNATNWNVAAGTPITVTPVQVAVNFTGGSGFAINVYDPTVGTSPISTVTTGNAVTVALADYPIIIDVLPANTATETISISPISTQTATTPFTVSGSIANAITIPSLQYSVNGGAYQPLPVSTGTRDPYLQPGSNNSVWNIPFGSGATWSSSTDPQTLAICSGTCNGIINPPSNYGETIYTSSSAADPTFSFSTNTNGRTIAPDNGSTLTATMHVPTGAYTPGPYPGDNQFILMDKTSYPNRVYTWAGITPPVQPPGLQTGQGPFGSVEGAEWDDITSDLFGQDWDSGLSGFDLAPGMITGCDTNPSCNPFFPQIKHGLRYMEPVSVFKSNAQPGTNNVLNPSGWPDRLQDYQSGANIYSGNLLFGQTLGIPLTTPMPSGLDANCQGLFWTMQHYPLIPRDAAGGGFHLSDDQVADQSAWVASARGCLSQLTGLLRVLTNQHQGGQSFTTQPANGPGTRIDTGPPGLNAGGANITQTSFYFTVPGLAANSANTISVRDANNVSVVGTSNQFAVNGNSGTLSGTPKSPLPSGYLHVAGNQIVDGSGNNVRLACTGYNEGTGNYGSDLSVMRSQGFNCARYPLYDATVCPGGTCGFSTLDAIVSAATANNMKIVFDHHGNEPSCGGQQQNGLWYDVNSNTIIGGVAWNALTQNVDGCGHNGTVTYAQFKANWTSIAQHYAGNSTVIGFDLDNEPFQGSSLQATPVNWGGNNGADARLMCADTGAAVEAADPGVLVICEGPIQFSGTWFNGTPWVSGARDWMDLSLAGSNPVTLAADPGSHVVYSVHLYPTDISDSVPDSGPDFTTMNMTSWGYLVANNTAPVWIGELGASLDNSNGNIADETAWATSVTQLMNGQLGAQGGFTFTGCQQPVGGDWWNFGNNAGQAPDGTLNPDGSNKAGQMQYWSTLLYTTCSGNGGGGGGGGGGGVGGTTWNSGDNVGTTLSSGNTISTGTGAHQGVRSTTSQTTGKKCFEETANTITANWTAGIANSTFNLAAGGGLGSDANGIGIDPNSTGGAQGIFYNNAALATGSGASPNGEAQTICVDLDAELWWSTNATQRAASHPWNNSATADPATGTGGISFAGLTGPYLITFWTSETGSISTINAAGPFAVTTPTGFSAWQAPITSGNHPIIINLGN